MIPRTLLARTFLLLAALACCGAAVASERPASSVVAAARNATVFLLRRASVADCFIIFLDWIGFVQVRLRPDSPGIRNQASAVFSYLLVMVQFGVTSVIIWPPATATLPPLTR